jgi:hypothetical protein
MLNNTMMSKFLKALQNTAERTLCATCIKYGPRIECNLCVYSYKGINFQTGKSENITHDKVQDHILLVIGYYYSIDEIPSRDDQRRFRIAMYSMVQKLNGHVGNFIAVQENYLIKDCFKISCKQCNEYHWPECGDDSYLPGSPGKDVRGKVVHRGAVRVVTNQSELTKDQRMRFQNYQKYKRKVMLQLLALFRANGLCYNMRRLIFTLAKVYVLKK